MTNFNEQTNTLLYKNIPLTIYSRKGWCWLCVRGELETGTDCSILTPSSSDHSSTSFVFWLGCSTVGHWGPKALCLELVITRASCLQLMQLQLTDSSSVAPGYIIVWRPPVSCGRTHLPPSPNSTTSTGQGDSPISSTGCTCFAVLLLIYTGVSLDWRLGRESICYIPNHWRILYSLGQIVLFQIIQFSLSTVSMAKTVPFQTIQFSTST